MTVRVALTAVNVVGYVVAFLFVVASTMLSTALLFVMSFMIALFFLLLHFKVAVIISQIIYIGNVSVGIAIDIFLLPGWDTLLEHHEELVNSTELFIERGWKIW